MAPGPSGNASPQSGPSHGHPASTQPQPSQQGSPPYTIKKKGERTFAKMKNSPAPATERTYEVRFDDQWQGRRLVDLHDRVHAMIDDVLRQARGNLADNDLGRVLVHHNQLANPIVVPLQPWERWNADKVMETVQNVLNSNEDLPLDESFRVTVGSIDLPKGGAGGHLKITRLRGKDNSIHRKKSMVQIVNADQMCMARAIGVCWASANLVSKTEWDALVVGSRTDRVLDLVLQHGKVPPSYYNKLKTKSRKEQGQLAAALCQMANISPDRPANIQDISAFEEALQVRILVIAKTMRFLRVGSNDHADRDHLYLFLDDHKGRQHFHSIVKITGFFSSTNFCTTCLKAFDHVKEHRCATTCIVCKSMKCPETDHPLSCRLCHMTCRSLDCFERHLVEKSNTKDDSVTSACQRWWRCTICKKVVDQKRRDVTEHRCGEWLCSCCDEWVMEGHLCYLRSDEPETKDPKYIFWDFECRQDDVTECQDGYAMPPPCDTCRDDARCKDCDRCVHCRESWCGKQRHIPNFVVAHLCCPECIDSELTPTSKCNSCGTRCIECDTRNKQTKVYLQEPCSATCGFREVIFEGDDTTDMFGQWLFSEQHKGFTAVAHNMKGYDGVFLLEYLIDHSIRPKNIIYNGSKIMYMYVERGLRIRVIDSLNFLPMRLADLPKAFGLDALSKGFFPHYFNRRGAFQRHVGRCHPDVEYYGADTMSTKDREAFWKWYSENKDKPFDFRKEIEAYCRSDVDILRRACLKFRALLLKATQIDPLQSVTIAAVCMKVFRTLFLEEDYKVKMVDKDGEMSDWFPAVVKGGELMVSNGQEWITVETLKNCFGWSVAEKKCVGSSIAQVPSEGYVKRDQYSHVSIQWLEWVMEKSKQEGHPLFIQHALNGGEVPVPGTKYRLDGYCAETHTAYEFNGCLWHACPTCYPHDRTTFKHPRTKQSMEELYALTMKKKRHLQKLGYRYVGIWEHEFGELLEKNGLVSEFVRVLDIQERLEPRHAFFGGRTNAVKLHYKAKEGETIKYVDFCSLYPYVNKYCEYPVGHPVIITDNFGPLSEYFGIVKVKVVPPTHVYHPVLPCRSLCKLMFPLCRTCVNTEQQTPCEHTSEQRAIIGTWCTPELLKAEQKGYEVIKIYEVYHFEKTNKYDPETKEGGLFADYINTFLKYKQQASNWPEWCKSPTDKLRYMSNYQQREGVTLSEEEIEKNPGLRSLAKLCLNSFWGKFGQRLNFKQHTYFHEEEIAKFFNTLSDPTKQVEDFHILTDDTIQLSWTHNAAFIPDNIKTNIFLAAFTTCWARLKLYDILDSLQERVLYFDTDSVIYVSRHGMNEPPLGDYLGDLTDELDGDNIVEFVSGGPKNYAYTTNSGKQVCKVRGFSLNHANSQLINFDTIRDMIINKSNRKRKRNDDDDDEHPTKVIRTTNSSKITRDKNNRIIYNRSESKRYRLVYTKRVIQPNLDTLPYGY